MEILEISITYSASGNTEKNISIQTEYLTRKQSPGLTNYVIEIASFHKANSLDNTVREYFIACG